MKKIRMLLGLSLLLISTPSYAGEGGPRYIEVRGDAELIQGPDHAEINFSVIGRDKKLSEAEEVFDEIDAAVGVVLEEAGFGVDDIFAMNRRIRPILKKNKIDEAGYRIEKIYKVVSLDDEQVNTLLKGLIEAGVGDVSGIEYKSSRVKEFETNAIVAATQDAQNRALAVAKQLGVELGEIITVVQEFSQFSTDRGYDDGFGAFGSFGDEPAVQASPGQIHFKAEVVLKIAIK